METARSGHKASVRHRPALAAICIALLLCSAGCTPPRPDRPIIGAKNFTEQVLLGELLAQHIEARTRLKVDRRFYLAGSYICQQALAAGRIDGYVEYTGTALTAILKQPWTRTAHVFSRQFSVFTGNDMGSRQGTRLASRTLLR